MAGLVLVLLGGLFWMQHQQEQEALTLEHQAAQAYLDRSLEDLDAAKEKLEEAVSLYRQIIEEFPGTPSAHAAWYFIGNALAEPRRPHRGHRPRIGISSTSQAPILRYLGWSTSAWGPAYLANGEREKAIDAYDRVLHIPHTLNKDQVLFELAKLEEHAKRDDEALARYKQLLDEHPNSPYVSEATLRVKILEPPAEDAEEESEATKPEEEKTTPEEKPSGE